MTPKTDKTLSVVIPCFNEQAMLDELHARVDKVCRSTFESNYEIVLVDDGSSDGTWARLCGLSEGNPNVVAVKLSRNFGHQVALSAGLHASSGDYVLVLDADLQDPPEHLPAMLDQMVSEGADVVVGVREKRYGETFLKKKTASLFYRTLKTFSQVEIPVDAGDFRLMSRRVTDALLEMPEHDRFIRGLVAWVGFKQTYYYYQREPRQAGVTKYSWRKMLRFALDAFLGHTRVLLRISIAFSVLLILIFAVLLIYAIYSWLFLNAVQGWTSLTLVVLAASSGQLLVLSILGEYIGRIYMETKDRPLFIIDRRVGDGICTRTQQNSSERSKPERFARPG